MYKESIISRLNDFKVFIKHEAKTGEDLYDGFKNFKEFAFENWPKDMPDNGNWKIEAEKVLGHIYNKREVKNISKSRSLRDSKGSAVEAVHAIITKFDFYFNKK